MVFKGMSLWQIGIVEGIYHLTSLLCEVPTGALADLLGRKKVILVGRIFSAISSLLCLFGGNMWNFALAFSISAIGQNLNSGSEEALVYDSMKELGQEERYIKVNGRLNVLIEIAQGIATVLGGVIAEYSFAWCYIISVFVAFLALIPALLFVEPKVKNDNNQDKKATELGSDPGRSIGVDEFSVLETKRKVFAILKDHFKVCIEIIRSDVDLRNILLYYPFVFTFHTIVFFYGQEFFSLAGLNKIEISMIMLFASMISILGALSSERMLSLFRHKARYVASTLMGFGILAMSRHNLIVSIIAFGIINYANAVLYPIQSAAINELIPSKQRATIISVNSMLFSVLMMILFPICGLVADHFDIHLAFFILGLLQLVIMVVLDRKKRKDNNMNITKA
jgi:MFS family permease